jgi:hypothetical protein
MFNMKKAIISFAAALCFVAAFLSFTSFITLPGSLSKAVLPASQVPRPEPITIHTIATSAEGDTYFGTVDVSGAFEATGTYEMPTEIHGMAIHCRLYMDLPDGTLTIRMNCNMVTSNGTWQILDGTGAYASAKGNGTLIMPDDVQEILTGDIRW